MFAVQVNPIVSVSSKKDFFFSVLQVFGASLFLAVCSQISIPLYFTPIPLSAHTLGIMVIGATLGSRKGVLSVLAYMAEGCLGLPVFAGGHFGVLWLLGPAGGYLLGYLFQVYLVGWFVERQVSFQGIKTLSVMLLSCTVQMGLGVLWLSFLVGKSAILMGFYPFVFGEIVKSVAFSFYLKKTKF